MNSHTRIARPSSVPSQNAPATMVFGASAPSPVSTNRLDDSALRIMSSACREERRPGLFVFATTHEGRIAGRLWLASTDTVRSGSVGRHHATDLAVTPDEALSLRHFLFIVRQVKGVTRYLAVDLETSNGLHTQTGREHLIESDRPVLLRTATLLFWCVPTRPVPMLPPDTTAARRLFDVPPQARRFSMFRRIVDGPSPVVGALQLTLGSLGLRLKLDRTLLEQGLLIGRDARCGVTVPDQHTSRVHALLLDVDGETWVFDTGSSNGVFVRNGQGPVERIRARQLLDRDELHIGNAVLTALLC